MCFKMHQYFQVIPFVPVIPVPSNLQAILSDRPSLSVHPQNVRFQNVRFQNVCFQNIRFQNVRFTKRQVSKHLVSKRPVLNLIYLLNKKYRIGNAKLALLFKVKSVSFLLITSDYGDIWQKNQTSSLCLQTWLQQNLRISTNHKYRIYGCFFCNRTFWRSDVL